MKRIAARCTGVATAILLGLVGIACSSSPLPTQPDGPVDDAAVDGPVMQRAYLKASNTDALDRFHVVALSADGTTLAVGAVLESSAAVGIDGDQDNNTASRAGAVYVFVRANGTWQRQAYLKASNTEAGDTFGTFLAISADGNTLAVGAPDEDSPATGIDGNPLNGTGDSGAVYVFSRTAGNWRQQAYVKASNTGVNDRFSSVALSADGRFLAVGAEFEGSTATGVNGDQTNDTSLSAGAVYVFTRPAATWSQQAYIKASNTGVADRFGAAVALSGDGATLAVGAAGEASAATGIGGDQANNSAPQSGAVYIFVRNGVDWAQQSYIKASNTQADDRFGTAVALSERGDTLAVGAEWEDGADVGIDGDPASNDARDSGAAYIFVRSQTTWAQQAYVKPSNARRSGEFGARVALSATGDALVVGAPLEGNDAAGVDGNDNAGGRIDSGAAYWFTRSGTTWAQRHYLKAAHPDSDHFGESVGLSGDGATIAVGAPIESSSSRSIDGLETDNSAIAAGAVYVFE